MPETIIPFTEEMRLNLDAAILKHEADIAGLSKRLDTSVADTNKGLTDIKKRLTVLENKKWWRFW